MFEKHQEIISCMELFLSKASEKELDLPCMEHLYQKCNRDVTDLHSSSKSPLVMASLDSLMGTLNFHQDLLKRCKHNQEDPFLTDHECVPMKESKGLDQICGSEEAKMYLREACIMPNQFPHLFKGKIKPWSRILLYGPPGTGKTSLARALSEEMECQFLSVSSADLLSSWVGESERHVKELFEKANNTPGKCIIFIDEIDSLCRQRSQTEDELSRRVKTELLCQLDGIVEMSEKVLVLAATNCPWDLDKAFLRRFERRIFVDVPDGNCRREILSNIFTSDQVDLDEQDWMSIVEETEGFSGSDLTHLAMAVAFIPIRELRDARFWRFNRDNMIMPCNSDFLGAMQYTVDKLPPEKVSPRPAGLCDFLVALKSSKKTVNSDLIAKYKSFDSNQ